MIDRPEGPRERILAATVGLIERLGPEGTTARAIAAEAGVNLASINYYFRTKEALLEAALDASLEHALSDLRDFLQGEPWEARESLLRLAAFLLEGGVRFPNLSRMTLIGQGGSSTAGRAAAVAAFVRDCAARVGASLGLPEGPVLLLRTSIFFSALLFPSLSPVSLPGIEAAEGRAGYAALAVEDYLASLGRPPGPEGAGEGRAAGGP